MRFLVQRVKEASVEVNNSIVGQINQGLLVFVGITHQDTRQEADYLINKLVNLRIFTDENDKMNLNVKQVGGEILLVSQFTLYADTTRGHRPDFIQAANPNDANELYEYIIKKCKETNINIQTGIFQADMKVKLINDGPVTVMLEK